MYTVEYRTGSGVTKKTFPGSISERTNDLNVDFTEAPLPLDMLPPIPKNIKRIKSKDISVDIDGEIDYEREPTDAELTAIEAEENS